MNNAFQFRLGSVPYRNVAPLIHGITPAPEAMVPSRLAEALFAGKFDAALVPIAEYLLHADAYALVDHVAIASRGPVYSVILVPSSPEITVKEIHTVALDPDSRTSVLLTRVLLELGWNTPLKLVAPDAPADARLIIGDPAIQFRKAHPDHPVFDLGELWQHWTELPFVYAAWVVRREAATPALGDFLRKIKETGLAARSALARDAAELHYFTESIRYELGAEEKMGILRFAEYLKDIGILECVPEINWI